MKLRNRIGIAAALLVVGAAGDRVITAGHTGSQPAAATSASTASSPDATSAYASTIPQSALASLPNDQLTEHAYAVASASVVYIVNVGNGSGSGIIYDAKGDIVTNNHVVSGASQLQVTLNNGKTYSAQLVGTDPADDLAVIRIHASNLVPARFADAGTYHVAQTVLAIGSPLGLKQSVTSGLISGLHRAEQEPSAGYLPDAIQTSAPISPGNSGGALVTLQGVVVGMPTLVQTSTQSGSAAQNIGFAIPSERIVLVANQIIVSGKVTHTGRPYLGITPSDSTGDSGSFFGPFGQNGSQSTVIGALVSQISSTGPAARAGVQQDDVITSADGTSVSNAQDLLTMLASKKPGQTIALEINRGGSTLSVHVRLGELPG